MHHHRDAAEYARPRGIDATVGGFGDIGLDAQLRIGKIELLDQNFALELTGLEAISRPGESLKITASAALGGKPMDVKL